MGLAWDCVKRALDFFVCFVFKVKIDSKDLTEMIRIGKIA